MAMAVGKGEGQSFTDINMTPLIDVMLVLLIIFIISLPPVTHAVKIDNPLPPPPNFVPPPPPEIVNLTIDFDGTLVSLDGNLGRNAGVAPWTVFDDLRVAKRIHFGERFNMDLIADMFNIANKFNVSAVSPLYTNAGTPTAAYDPRQFQFALKLNW